MSAHLLARTSASPYTAKSVRTIKRHMASAGYDSSLALKLLMRNVRDVQPSATLDTQRKVAQTILDTIATDSE